ncbi:bifunctional metallophosphatase/5'-nucleotidase [Oceanisphaera avium]|uniref:Bifunctional metallophosphatase/5'-nucleotidase n=1 Tax=Oceanisphaera avium TaxID=1903694 RepID=A0A1Y0CVY2_9GAMM|nr:5'-nucleotidase C-terminal domain-containing protein [Oceanisphaera avium]ART79493.1 bifunctional metallophosphatase/5'-nucleotidase [Oceanisphaera avium]
MKKTLMASLVALTLSGCASSQLDQPFSLTIAHINDTHAHFDASDVRLTFADNAVYTQAGGSARLLSYANQLSEQAKDQQHAFLFLHAGDAWQGTGYFKQHQGAMSADVLSRMHLDAMTLGEREFSLDNARLASFIEQVNFPVLAANLDTRQEPALSEQENLQPYVLYRFKGNKKQQVASVKEAGKYPVVAVFGLINQDLASQGANLGHLRVSDEISRAQSTVNALKEQGVNYIVALTHLGLEKDRELAQSVNGIDVIVGGHADALLGDFSDIGGTKNEPYAQSFTNPNGRGRTCVVQSGQRGQAMGKVTVTFTYDGRVSQCQGNNTLLVDSRFYRDASHNEQQRLNDAQLEQVNQHIAHSSKVAIVEEDKSLQQYIAKQYRPSLLQAYGKTIGMVPNTLNHATQPVDGKSSQVAPLVAASQWYWANTPAVQSVTGRQVDFALVSAGTPQQNIEVGVLKTGQINMGLLPSTEALSLVSLSGRQVAGVILEAINSAIAKGADGSQFPYVAGLRYEFNETSPGRGYVNNLEYQQQGQWTRLKPNQQYQVALSGFHSQDTLFDAQQVLTDRLDLAYVNGKLAAFPVARLTKNAHGKIAPDYINQPLNCQDAQVSCEAAAVAFTEYVQQVHPTLTPVTETGISLNRL